MLQILLQSQGTSLTSCLLRITGYLPSYWIKLRSISLAAPPFPDLPAALPVSQLVGQYPEAWQLQ